MKYRPVIHLLLKPGKFDRQTFAAMRTEKPLFFVVIRSIVARYNAFSLGTGHLPKGLAFSRVLAPQLQAVRTEHPDFVAIRSVKDKRRSAICPLAGCPARDRRSPMEDSQTINFKG